MSVENVSLVPDHECPLCGMILYFKNDKLGDYCCIAHKRRGMAKRVIKNCLICGREIRITPSQDRQGRGRYCSRACWATSQSRDMTAKT